MFPASAADQGSQAGGSTPQPSPPAGAAPSLNNPFPTPTPTPTPGPIGNGYVLFGYNGGNASGGVIPSTVATPSPFPASPANGFFISIAGRFSPSFTAMLHFDDYTLHGGDQPVVTRSDGAVYYTPGGRTLGFGLGYGSLQRSSNTASASGLGVGATLLPDFRQTLSPYVDLFYYPSARTLGTSAALFTTQAGVMVRVPRSGLLAKLGFDLQSYPNQSTSPTSLSGLQLGLGASF